MATKPSSILGYNPTRSNCVTIPAGKMAAGFLPGERPPARYFGDLFERIDRWLEYVKDGAWTGNTTITGTLGVNGATTIAGAASITGNTAVTGLLSASGLITGTSGFIAGVNQSYVAQGTGRYKHGDISLPVSAAGFAGGVDTSFSAVDDRWALGTSSTPALSHSLRLFAGQRIKTIDWTYNKNGQANAMDMQLIKRDIATDAVTVIDVLSSTTSGLFQVTTTRTPNYVVEAGFFIQLKVIQTTTGGGNQTRFHGAVVTIDDP